MDSRNNGSVHHSSTRLLYEMYPAAGRRRGLILAREPFHIFARTVAFDIELRASHVLKFDLDAVAGVQRLQPLVKSSCGNDVARTEADKLGEPGDLVRELVRHGAGVVVLARLTVSP